MTLNQMKDKIADIYCNTPSLREKLDKMPPDQVAAIYKKLEKRGWQIKPQKKMEPGIRCAVQLSIFDFPEFGGKCSALVQPEYRRS